MSVIIELHLKAKDAENYKALHETLKAILPDTAAFEGAHLISCGADEASHSFVIHEVWENVEAQQKYMGWRQERGDVDTLVSMLGEPPKFIEREHLTF